MRRRRAALIIFGAAALLPIVVRDAYFLDAVILVLLWGALASAWNVAAGYAGQASLGHSSFFGIGAYAAGLFSTRFGLSPWLGLLAGVVVSIFARSEEHTSEL